MPHRIRNGLIDYLETMLSSGVELLGPPLHLRTRNPLPECEPVTEQEQEIEIEQKSEPASEPKGEPERSPQSEPVCGPVVAEKGEVPMPKKNASEDRTDQLRVLAEKVSHCALCGDLAISRTQTVFGDGNPHSRLVFLGEAPGADEDEQGIPFVGRAGKLLDDIITKGMNLRREEVYICNILRCRPPANRPPTPKEALLCRPFLDATLAIVKPEFICCLGTTAAQKLLDTDTAIGALRGKKHDYKGIRVICTYHPAYLLRTPSAKKETWNDIKVLMKEMGLPVE